MKNKFFIHKQYGIFYVSNIDNNMLCIAYLNNSGDFTSEWIHLYDIKGYEKISFLDKLKNLSKIKYLKEFIS